LKNDKIMFISEDKIVKGVNVTIPRADVIDGDNEFKIEEDFLVSHCTFPGSKNEICLATILSFGPENNLHLIGENCLTYY